jgi:hypothetical protein
MNFWQVLFVVLALSALYQVRRQYQSEASALKIASTLTLAGALLLTAETTPFVQLALFGKESTAIVLKKDCAEGKKKRIYYQFNVGDRLESGIATGGYGKPACEHIEAGTTGSVYYLPTDPSVRVWGQPRDYLGECLVGGAFLLPIAFIFSLRGFRKLRANFGQPKS